MPVGNGKYDHLCTLVRCATGAAGAVVLIIDGDQGSGFSVQVVPDHMAALPDVLIETAEKMRREFAAVQLSIKAGQN